MSAMWFESALEAHPELEAEMAEGRFETLLNWLAKNVHTHGRKFTIPELVERAVGKEVSAEPYISYLKTKYSQLYGLSSA